MKSLIIAALMTASLNSHAATQIISPKEFIKNINNYLMHLSSDDKVQFVGDLDEIGGECTVTLEKDEKGRMNIVMKSDKGFQIGAVIFNDDKIKLKSEESEDGSFSHVYSFGIGGVNKFTMVSVDDAYETITLQTGSTSLQCGVYF